LVSDFIAETKQVLDSRPAVTVDSHSLVPAAVLLALYEFDGDLRVVLQKRSQQVEHHKGEISFPGGMVDPGDETYLDTALREAHEEMGIRPQDVRVLGRLDDMPTISHFMISTYVGAIPSPYAFTPSSIEVAEVLLPSIADLRDADTVREEARLEGDDVVTMPCYTFDGHVIFGATARILGQFIDLTRDVEL
jgi:8-oxo-dGTP pyrophosphatase MutT (NUDIX family)